MTQPRIAVVGVSSLVGTALVEELRARRFPSAVLNGVDDARNLGATVTDQEEDKARLPVQDVATFDFAQTDLVFFCGREALAQRYAAEASAHAWVIDASSAHRARSDVPLVVADVNPAVLEAIGDRGLIALPGSASVALSTVLAPLDRLAGLERVEVASYHAVSGAGRGAMEELAAETVAMLNGKTPRGRAFGRPIAFNVIPAVDLLEADGTSREERRVWEETRRVLARPSLAVNVTAVRVPVFFGHGLAVHASFDRAVTAAAAAAVLRDSAGIDLVAPDSSLQYPTPAGVATAMDRIYVGRLRADPTRDRALNFWIVADNVRKCAAHNAVSVAQILVNRAR